MIRWPKSAQSRSARSIEYADDYAPVEPLFGWDDRPSRGWQVSDDVGTEYEPGNAGASGSDSGFKGEVEFDPARPAVVAVSQDSVASMRPRRRAQLGSETVRC